MYIEKNNAKKTDAWNTPILLFNEYERNHIFIKREDLIPYSFGGNKARKAFLFFQEIEKQKSDCVVTYGSSHSNHCRVVANLAAAKNIPCYIIAPIQVDDITFNSQMMRLLGAKITTVPVEIVSSTIQQKLNELQEEGYTPYFIPGGGHGNIGTEAYVQCYEEIKQFEKEQKVFFDYIFFASGTGTTHAGLVCGKMIHNDVRNIVGISIARKNPRGRDVVVLSIAEYLQQYGDGSLSQDIERINSNTVFLDEYIKSGYGKGDSELWDTIKEVMVIKGLPLDSTYTGKAYWGMMDYIKRYKVKNKNILFIHTGGTPLFFDDLQKFMSMENRENYL